MKKHPYHKHPHHAATAQRPAPRFDAMSAIATELHRIANALETLANLAKTAAR